ncbi:amino acid adenylation domain-containing protein [Micromonospora sp. WMMD1102]|uniref:amino acid adenylation domain-containing protein n=1 Tax=Micromonospora sp. WMMD1102 TaxID=3016105 RepID=UPI0024156B86|nr:amino acid adenylation domain-containing protein [Micromonospora sp. WMMD1102]MDG4789718.1 amino acid adenylation domain-containing protein [Micromonospora sp. WMMD1102]
MFDKIDARVLAWNQTATAYPRDASLVALFDESARLAGSACAVVDGDRSLDYQELHARSNGLAHVLEAGGVRGRRVGVLGKRCADAVVAMLAILKAGGAYVPLDDSYPPARLHSMLEAAGVGCVVVLPGQESAPSMSVPTFDVGDASCPDPPRSASEARGEDLACVMFTSGSTGQPKAVGMRHRNISRLAINSDFTTLDGTDRVLHASSPSFDASLFEIWCALLRQAGLVVLPSSTLLSPGDFQAAIHRHGITTAFLTTAVFHYLARRRPGIFGELRELLVGGEVVNPERVRQVLSSRPPGRLVHCYGPTEGTTFTTTYPITKLPARQASIPIGRPIANAACYVLRADGTPADVDESGELWIGGDGVTAGYLNDTALTAERFRPDPFDTDPSARLYRTGDRALWRADGVIEFLGRVDTQIKILGHRIEPAEIEYQLCQEETVAEAVVTREESDEGEAVHLVAHIVPVDGASVGAAALRRSLAQRLPTYLVPTRFHELDRLPLLPSGKVDRAALPSARPAAPPTRDGVLEQTVRLAWLSALAGSGIDPDFDARSTLFELGCGSLDLIRIHDQVASLFPLPDLSVTDLFAHPSLRAYTIHLAGMLDRASAHTAADESTGGAYIDLP